MLPETVARIWRVAVAPFKTTAQLLSLERELAEGGPHLLQGATVSPPPLHHCRTWRADRCCLLAFDVDLGTVEDTENRFFRTLQRAWETLNGPSGVCPLLHYWDESPRDEVIAGMLDLVRQTLRDRQPAAAVVAL